MLKNVSTELTPAEAHGKSIITHSSGPVGASRAVRESNWKCGKCKADNFAKRDRCVRCKATKDVSSVEMKSLVSSTHEWREAFDPNSRQLYYYNIKTKETTWTRPKEMGAAVYNTGWFGRGRQGYNGREFLDTQNAEFLKRPAIKQAENLAKRDVAYKEGGHEYNIWYNRYTGDGNFEDREAEPADTRLKLKLHAGYTLADNVTGERTWFCIWFARGKCAKGSQCKNYHRIPTYEDVASLEQDMLHDCFGRERHASQRDDMAGIGSFNDPSRTLYVGRLQRSKYLDNPKELKSVLERNFMEFGEIESVNVVWRLSIGFVRYRFRAHCEFAKVAMDRQALDNEEVLLIRWAYEDPNPVAKEAVQRANADAVVTAIKSQNHSLQKTPFNMPKGSNAIKNKREIGPQWYPDTNSQYKKKPRLKN